MLPQIVIASLVQKKETSPPFWGTVADKARHKVIVVSGLMAAILGLIIIWHYHVSIRITHHRLFISQHFLLFRHRPIVTLDWKEKHIPF
ncbi:hypothetical protein ACNR9Q_05840 [Maribacter sp. X9]|uniref:hypothetical protein n=1 Tax=Maribacter sp. X9 TaxID=3402159 RepID=UPI003AF36C8C